MFNKTYSADEIFQDIEGEEDLCLMVIPQEIIEATAWLPGDTLSIEVEDNKLILRKA